MSPRAWGGLGVSQVFAPTVVSAQITPRRWRWGAQEFRGGGVLCLSVSWAPGTWVTSATEGSVSHQLPRWASTLTPVFKGK